MLGRHSSDHHRHRLTMSNQLLFFEVNTGRIRALDWLTVLVSTLIGGGAPMDGFTDPRNTPGGWADGVQHEASLDGSMTGLVVDPHTQCAVHLTASVRSGASDESRHARHWPPAGRQRVRQSGLHGDGCGWDGRGVAPAACDNHGDRHIPPARFTGLTRLAGVRTMASGSATSVDYCVCSSGACSTEPEQWHDQRSVQPASHARPGHRHSGGLDQLAPHRRLSQRRQQ